MARTRKVNPQLWNEKSFETLSTDSQLVFLFLLTHPHMTSLGAMRATLLGLAMELFGSFHRFYVAIEVLRKQGLVKYDVAACLVWLPTFLQHNPPGSPNAVKSWARILNALPECPLRKQLIRQVKQFVLSLSPAFQRAVPAVLSPFCLEIDRLIQALAE